MRYFKSMSAIVIVLAMILVACKPTNSDAMPTDQLDDIRTVAARTIEALTTQMLQTDYAKQTETGSNTVETPVPPTEAPHATDDPLVIPSATFGETPTPTDKAPIEEKPCDLAFFMGETIPDGSVLYPGTMFTKTWTLRNEGSCTWTPDYAVVFISGDSMSVPAAVQLSQKEVKPGETVDISVPLIAPTRAGDYRADFRLRNAAGVLFAFKKPEQTFWADIQVVEGVIHLANSYCGATWTSHAGSLHCPGLPTDAAGYVYSDNAPTLENGTIDDEPTLWMGLTGGQDAFIMGVFPAMQIPENAKFTTVLGCSNGMTQCRVKFVLAYQEGEAPLQQLGSWDEVYDDQLQRIRLDLSALGGRTVKIILIARPMDSSVDGRIHLLEPVIKP